MSNDIGKNKKPHIVDTLKQARKVRVYLLAYAAIGSFILWMYPSDWLGFVLVFGFGFLASGRLNKLFSGSDWNLREQDNKEGDISDDKQ